MYEDKYLCATLIIVTCSHFVTIGPFLCHQLQRLVEIYRLLHD